MEQTGVEQGLHHHGHPTHPVEVDHVVLPVRLGVGDVGYATRHPVEVVKVEMHPGLGGDGQEVQHGVGGTTKCVHHGNGVLECLLGQDLARGDPIAQQVHHSGAAGVGVVVTAAVRSGRRCRAG